MGKILRVLREEICIGWARLPAGKRMLTLVRVQRTLMFEIIGERALDGRVMFLCKH